MVLSKGGIMKVYLQILLILLACFALGTTLQAAQVYGLVTDAATNLPVSNAKVFALGYMAGSGDSIVFETYTGKDGLYAIEQMPAGDFWIGCQHPDYLMQRNTPIELADDSRREVNFELLLQNSTLRNHISGHVYSTPPLLPVFIPIPNAKVWLTGANGLTYQTFTDDAGKYIFSNIIPGVYTVSAAARGHKTAIDVEKIEVEPELHIENLDIHLIPVEPVPNYQLSGSVFDEETGEPVFPAFITVVLTDPSLYQSPLPPEIIGITVRNNEDGSYLIEKIPAGIFDVVCTARGYETKVVPKVDFTSADQILDFYLIPITPPVHNLLAGTIYDANSGDALPDVHLTLSNLSGPELDGPEIIYHTRSDKMGYYQFYNILPGKYQLTAFKRGYYPFTDTLAIDENTWITDFDLKLEPFPTTDQVTLWGYVWDRTTDQVPVYPAHIEVLGFTAAGDSLYYHTLSNPDGSYKIAEIHPGYYKLRCSARGYETEVFCNFPLFEPEVQFDFYLTPKIIPELGTIAGKVYFDGTLAPVHKAQIHFIPVYEIQTHLRNENDSIYRTYTNERGLYKANLPPGKYIVSCRYQYNDNLYIYHEFYDNVHSIDDAAHVPVMSGEVTEGIDFGIPGLNNIKEVVFTGRVTDDAGLPLARALVRVWELSLPIMRTHMTMNTYMAYTDDNGEYKIVIDLDRQYFTVPWPVYAFIAAANKEGYKIEFFEEKPTIFEADIFWAMSDTTFSNVNFTLEPSDATNSISGQVTGAGGTPLANAFVMGIPEKSGKFSFAFTDNQGHYTLDNLQNESYYILFMAQRYLPEFYDDATVWEDADPVTANGTVDGIDAELTPLIVPLPYDSLRCMLAGRVMHQNGNPLEGALIMVRNRSQEMVNYGITDQYGNYQIDGLSDGIYEVTVTKVNFASATTEIEINSARADITLFDFSLTENLTSVPVSDPNPVGLPTQLALLPNYPNPFNPSTKIEFTLPEALAVDLSVFDILGRRIKTLVRESLPPGRYSVTWNGSDTNNRSVSSGIYFYVLETPGQRLVGKLVLNR